MTRFLLTALALSALGAAETPTTAPTPYPLDTCLVSGDKLGAMGKPTVIVRDGREIKLCCKGCIKDLDKDPAKFLKQLDAKAAKAK